MRCQKRLLRRRSPAQRIEGDPFGVKINLGSHESMRPIRIDLESVPQQICLTLLCGPSQEDHFASKGILEVQFPVFGEGTPSWGTISPAQRPCTMGSYISVGLGFQGCQGIVMKTGPDFSLPACVQAFNGRLKSCLPRRGKDRYDAQAEAQARYPADRVFKLMRPLKTRVVIELGITGQAKHNPMLDQGLCSQFGGDSCRHPRAYQSAVNGYAVQYFHMDSALDNQAFHDVETVQFSGPIRYRWQVPAGGRRGSAYSAPAVKRAASPQDTGDGTERWNPGDSLFEQFAPDRQVSILSQDAPLFQLPTDPQNPIFHRLICAPNKMCYWRAISPVDPFDTFPPCPMNPKLDGGKTHAKSASCLSYRLTPADSLNDRFAYPHRNVFFGMLKPPLDHNT
jgi:hypothetical protein